MNQVPRIFVSIAAYRDAECQRTLDDLFAKAANPDRVTAGVCWQAVPETDDDLRPVPPRPGQCRMLEYDARESRGACWARHLVHGLWQGEEYYLQIDAHTRFVEGWDEAMIATLGTCPSERAVLSAYPPPYKPPAELQTDHVRHFAGIDFVRNDIPTTAVVKMPLSQVPTAPSPTYQCSGAFLFGPGAMVSEVPYDPYIYFYGEEVTYAVRLWTHGWDLFSPNRLLIWHNYVTETRPRHWRDSPEWPHLERRSNNRVHHLLGMFTARDPEVLAELDRYGLGTARSLADYQAASGIDFSRQRVNGRIIEEGMTPESRRLRNRQVFEGVWKKGSWGTQETHSGSGATLRGSALIREALPRLFKELSIEILADAGCGELNWMNLISPGLRLYLGIDIVPGVVSGLVQRFGRRTGHFFAELDITEDVLPRCDAILCRDVLSHYPAMLAGMALDKFKRSGSRFLIATQTSSGINRRVAVGDWHPIDLTAPPFSLPPPLTTLKDGKSEDDKVLAVWRLEDL